MEQDKLKIEIDDYINKSYGKVSKGDLKRFVSTKERQPTEEGYYIVLRGDSNPNFIYSCHPAVHYWYLDEKKWSSETEYWMENVHDSKDELKSNLGNPLSINDCLELGFEKIPTFTIADNLIYQLGRNRHLSIACVGTPNEMLFICESDPNDYRKITDLICLHNFDCDGYLSKSKLQILINYIK